MSIITNFINNTQDLIYSNLILSLSETTSQKDIIIQKQKDLIASLRKSLNYQKRKNKQLSLEIKKLSGTYNEPNIETSRSPLYEYFKLDKEAIRVPIVSSPSVDYKDILSKGNFKHSKAYLKPNFPKPNQLCPNCNSPKEWHYLHTKTQKRCKLCLKTFIFNEPNKNKILEFHCPYCEKALVFRVSRSSFDVYCCKNKACPYRIKAKNQIINEHGKLNPRDKISYIYRNIKISLNDVFKFVDSSNSNIPKSNFKFRNFNSQIFSKVIYFKVNLKLSNRDTALAMKDLYGINISHTTINTYCNMASSLVSCISNTKTNMISNQIVGDETYIKIKGKKHYVWILFDLKYENIVAYHISEKRDFNACATVFLKLIEKYKEIPKNLFVMTDKYTAYPMALQFIQKELGITIHHTAVKGLTSNKNEDNKTRIAKQKIERLNRVFKESYRITTGYFNISGARHSFELWMFYFNYMRLSKGIFKNSLDFIDTKSNIEDFNMPAKWALVFDYIRLKLSS